MLSTHFPHNYLDFPHLLLRKMLFMFWLFLPFTFLFVFNDFNICKCLNKFLSASMLQKMMMMWRITKYSDLARGEVEPSVQISNQVVQKMCRVWCFKKHKLSINSGECGKKKKEGGGPWTTGLYTKHEPVKTTWNN